MALRFALASHQQLLRDLLREHLLRTCGGELVAEFTSTQQLQREAAKLRHAELLFVDGDMADGCPLPVIRGLITRRLIGKVVLLTDMPGSYLAEAGVLLGIRGVIHKRDSLESVLAAMTTIVSGGLYISPQVDLAGRKYFSRMLSGRELDVLRLQASGVSLAKAARTLKLTPSTVLTHRKNYMRKLGLTTQLGITLFAISSGLVPLSCVRADLLGGVR